MLSLQKLHISVVVAESGSFNKAAAALLMSQSAVSQHIQDLEAALGTQLFVRSAQGVQPTDAGNLLIDYARRMLQLADDLEHDIRQLGWVPKKQLNIGTTPGISVYILPGWLQAFQQAYPQTTISSDAVLTARVTGGVLQQAYDLGFLEGDLDDLDNPDLGRFVLQRLDYRVVTSPQHPWAARKSIDPGDLAGVPFINRQANSRTRQWLAGALAAVGVTLNNTAELDSPGTVKYAVLSNMGVAVLPLYAVQGEVSRGELHLLTLQHMDLQRALTLIWDKRRPFDPLQHAFLSTLRHQVPAVASLLP